MSRQANLTADEILRELRGRGGFDHWWYEIDRDIQDDICESIAEIIENVYGD